MELYNEGAYMQNSSNDSNILFKDSEVEVMSTTVNLATLGLLFIYYVSAI